MNNISLYMTHELKINNKRLFDFYSKNPTINIETMNLILLDFLEKLSLDMTQLMQSSFNGQLLSEIKELKQQMNTLQESFILKMSDNNKTFIETLKDKLQLSGTENNEKLFQLLNRNTDLFIERMSSLLPKTQDETSKKIQEHLSQVQKNIQNDIQQYILNKTDTSLHDFISSFESKLSTLQSPIFSLINANQENISTKIGLVKDDLLLTKLTTEKVYSDLNQHLNKYTISSHFKGMCAEIDLHKLLNDAFPTYEIIKSTGDTGCGDFMIRKDDENHIMIEMKNHTTNVDRDEVKKFLRDVTNLKTHAIMISNQCGIIGKPNFHIEIDDSCILVYLHNLQFSTEKIKMAVNVIENLSTKLKIIEKQENEEGITIKKEVLDKINNELTNFIESKSKLTNLLKEQQKIALTQIEMLDFPDLSLFLQDKYVMKPKKFACDMCDRTFDTRAQMSAHKKRHTKKDELVNTIINMKEDVDEVLPEINEFDNMNMAQLKEECKKRRINTSGKKKEELINLLK
jgi:hypothetical protein